MGSSQSASSARSQPLTRNALSDWAVHTICFASAFCLIYLFCSRRFVDFTDEGFYYTSAWLAYSDEGQLPVSILFMNFGKLLGMPYLLTEEPRIIDFRLLSLLSWYLAHFWFLFRVNRLLHDPLGPVWLHVLCLIALYVFLIPSLSYQNMPYLFVLIAFAMALQLKSTQGPAGMTLSLLLPLPIALAVVAYSPFAALAPFVGVAVYRLARLYPAFSVKAFIGGIAMAVTVLVLLFDARSIAQADAALVFLNSEVEYSGVGRIWSQAVSALHATAGSAIAGLVVVGIALALSYWRRAGNSFFSLAVLIGYFVVASGYLLRSGSAECRMTCDAAVIDLIDITVAGIPVIFLLTSLKLPHRPEIPVFTVTYLAIGIFMAALSNAPYHYNLKYASPALIGVLVLLLARLAPPRRLGIAPVPTVATILVISLGAGRHLLLSTYGASSMWHSNVPLPGPKFSGLYGEPSRAAMITRLSDAYARHNCGRLFFAAVDSLVLPYFLFARRPPFPHAWLGTRVAGPREIIAAQPTGCIIMQDRVLPGTPADATTMLDYLKLNPAKDWVDVADIGDNIFLIRFARATNI